MTKRLTKEQKEFNKLTRLVGKEYDAIKTSLSLLQNELNIELDKVSRRYNAERKNLMAAYDAASNAANKYWNKHKLWKFKYHD